MRERDMRLRVERFLQSRLRSMLMPATVGLGLALGGCASDALSTDDGGDEKDLAGDVAAQSPETGKEAQAVPIYSIVMPRDAGPELPLAQPDYMAQMPDSGPVVRYMAVMPDARVDPGDPVAIYIAQIPDPRA